MSASVYYEISNTVNVETLIQKHDYFKLNCLYL